MADRPEIPARTILALDYGRRRIGLATASTIGGIASALRTLPARAGEPNWQQLDELIAEWQPDLLVIGLPLNVDGTESEMSAEARQFAETLQSRYKLPAEFIDERYTSAEAEDQLQHERRLGVKKKKLKKEDIDARAAQIIAASWLQRTGNQAPS